MTTIAYLRNANYVFTTFIANCCSHLYYIPRQNAITECYFDYAMIDRRSNRNKLGYYMLPLTWLDNKCFCSQNDTEKFDWYSFVGV